MKIMSSTATKDYLKFVSQHNRVAQFILDNGRSWPVGSRTFAGRKARQGRCFHNAFKMAMADPGLTYVEGYAASVIPMHHAWCVDRAGQVIDPTWRPTDVVTHDDYFGVAFDFDYVLETVGTCGVYGLLDHFHNRKTIVALLEGTTTGWAANLMKEKA